MTGLFIVLGISALLIAAILSGPWRQRRRRARLQAAAVPAAWAETLTRNLPVYRRLPADLRARLHKVMQIFLAEKTFIGCDGLEVTEEMRVTIAAQACLLVANLGIERYDSMRALLLYPDAFRAEHEHLDDAGVHTMEEKELGGESWPEGKVVLSWRDVREGLEGAPIGGDAYNVVYHEFAHQLDQADGDANGAPLLEEAGDYRRWSAVFQQEYQHLLDALDAGENTLLPEDAAENPGEFFAIATEVFLEQPRAMQARHPALYAELRDYYRLDPATW